MATSKPILVLLEETDSILDLGLMDLTLSGIHTIYIGALWPTQFPFYQFQEFNVCPDCQSTLVECRCGGL